MSETKPTVLGIIPARGGSKSIPKKNIALLCGKPLIAWTVEAALRSSALSRVIVSTDDKEIAELVRQWGAEVPFLRPDELARDHTPVVEPVLHTVRWLDEHEGYCPDYVMVLQPTSPLRTAQDIEAAVQLAWERQADGVVSVCPVYYHPYWTKSVTEDGRLTDFLALDRTYTRRQDLPPAHALNGAIYLISRKVLLERQTFYTDRTYAYVMPLERSLDIDMPWDLHIAGLILKDRMYHERD